MDNSIHRGCFDIDDIYQCLSFDIDLFAESSGSFIKIDSKLDDLESPLMKRVALKESRDARVCNYHKCAERALRK